MNAKDFFELLKQRYDACVADAEAIAADESMPPKVRDVAMIMVGAKDLIGSAIEFAPVERALRPILDLLTGEHAAQNYVTVDLDGFDGRKITLTAQCADGKTPAEELHRLERELGLKLRMLDQAHANLTAVQERCTALLEENRELRAKYEGK